MKKLTVKPLNPFCFLSFSLAVAWICAEKSELCRRKIFQDTVNAPFPFSQPEGTLTISIIGANFSVMISVSFLCFSLPLNFFPPSYECFLNKGSSMTAFIERKYKMCIKMRESFKRKYEAGITVLREGRKDGKYYRRANYKYWAFAQHEKQHL